MRLLPVALLVAFSLALLSGCGGGGDTRTPDPTPTTGTVDGYVYYDRASAQMVVAPSANATSTGLSGVSVTVRGYPALSAETNGDGFFSIANVPTGMQQFYFANSLYTRITVTATVTAGNNHLNSLSMNVAAKQKWTILVYMAADNNLIPYAYSNFNDMEKAPASPVNPDTNQPYVRTLVLFDRPASYGESCLYEVQHDDNPTTITSPVLRTMVNLDSGNPASLNEFITWGQTYAPAEHYLLILWDHGSGWDPDSDRARPRAISFDDTSGTVIRDIDLPSAMQGRDPIDIVAMDACLMSMLEVAYQIRHQADYQVSSEELTPVDGYYYANVVGKLTTGTGYLTSPHDYAIYLAQDAFRYWNEDTSPYYPLTCSALDLSRIDAVASALDGFAARLLAVGAANRTGLTTVRQDVTRFNAYSDGTIVDLKHLAALVSTNISDTQLRSYATKVQSAVSQAVIANEHTTSRDQASGISIYMPGKRAYFNSSASTSYPLLDLSKATHWDEWLSGQPE